MGRTQRPKVGAWEIKYFLMRVWMTESASRAKWKKGFFLFFKKWGLLIFVIKTSIKYFFRNEKNMVPCLWRNKLSNKYIRDKVEIMVVLFFERWKSVDKLWCLWTNYGLTLLVLVIIIFRKPIDLRENKDPSKLMWGNHANYKRGCKSQSQCF